MTPMSRTVPETRAWRAERGIKWGSLFLRSFAAWTFATDYCRFWRGTVEGSATRGLRFGENFGEKAGLIIAGRADAARHTDVRDLWCKTAVLPRYRFAGISERFTMCLGAAKTFVGAELVRREAGEVEGSSGLSGRGGRRCWGATSEMKRAGCWVSGR